jgi:hypothetical protein
MAKMAHPSSQRNSTKEFIKNKSQDLRKVGRRGRIVAHESTFLCHFDGSIRGRFRPVRDPGRGWREETLQEPLWLLPWGWLRLLSAILSRLRILSPVLPKLLSAVLWVLSAVLWWLWVLSAVLWWLWGSGLLPCHTTSSDRHRWRLLVSRGQDEEAPIPPIGGIEAHCAQVCLPGSEKSPSASTLPKAREGFHSYQKSKSRPLWSS